MSNPFRCLVISGGGERGAMTAEFLAALDIELWVRYSKGIYKYFDMISSTSVGGIIVYVRCSVDTSLKRMDRRGPASDAEEAKYEDPTKAAGILSLYDEVAFASILDGNRVFVINNDVFGDTDKTADMLIAVAERTWKDAAQ